MNTKLLFTFAALAQSATAATVALTGENLGNPTQGQLLSGYTVDNFAGFLGLSITITATGNFDTSETPSVSADTFHISMPTANANSEPSYVFEFNGNGVYDITELGLSSTNNIYGVNNTQNGFISVERVRGSLTGGSWDTFSANPGANSDQLITNGLGSTFMGITMAVPSGNPATLDSTGYSATASGGSITAFTYIYDLRVVENGWLAPEEASFRQPFSLSINVEPVPEPSGLALLSSTALLSILRRRRG